LPPGCYRVGARVVDDPWTEVTDLVMVIPAG
jgi:hypothetical protein